MFVEMEEYAHILRYFHMVFGGLNHTTSSCIFSCYGIHFNELYFIFYQGAGKLPGSEKKKKNPKKIRKKSKKSCQCINMFLSTQSKNSNLRRGLNHVPINQIV